MRLFTLPDLTRRQWAMALVHVAMLAIALLVGWQKDGPPPEKAFWAIMIYFVEIAIAGAVEIVWTIIRRLGRDRA
jgi:hypothetical protein